VTVRPGTRMVHDKNHSLIARKTFDCAGEYADYWGYKNGNLFIVKGVSSCQAAYNKAKQCYGTIDNDSMSCNTVLACAPYVICQ
jgi:hypothetical protein